MMLLHMFGLFSYIENAVNVDHSLQPGPEATAGLCLGVPWEAGQQPGNLCLQRLGSVVRFSIVILLQKAPYKVALQV